MSSYSDLVAVMCWQAMAGREPLAGTIALTLIFYIQKPQKTPKGRVEPITKPGYLDNFEKTVIAPAGEVASPSFAKSNLPDFEDETPRIWPCNSEHLKPLTNPEMSPSLALFTDDYPDTELVARVSDPLAFSVITPCLRQSTLVSSIVADARHRPS